MKKIKLFIMVLFLMIGGFAHGGETDCKTSTLSSDYILHIPVIEYNSGTDLTHLWANMMMQPSNDGRILFELNDYGIIEDQICEKAILSSEFLLHVPTIEYNADTGITHLWASMMILPSTKDRFLFELIDCGLIEEEIESDIDEKIQTQFSLYGQAQTKAIERIVEQQGFVGREEWDSWITPAPEDILTEAELKQISDRQTQTIADRRQEVLTSATLDLDLIRNDETKLQAYCMEFPKGAMLHIHPSGTRNLQTVKEILENVNPVVDGQEILKTANDGELSMLYPHEVEYLSNLPVLNYLDYDQTNRETILDFFFLPNDPPTHDFKRFEAIFTINDLLDSDPAKAQWVEEKTYLDFLKRCAAQNVSYVEFTRVMYPNSSTFEQLHTWAKDWYAETGVIVRWNSAFVRTLDYDTNTAWTNELIDLLENNQYPELVGIDLLANETDTPALTTGQNIYIPVLAANRSGRIELNRTMHAGELGSIYNVRDAMIMGTQRVGHGVLLAKDPLSLEYAVKEKNLPIEINLYSNYRLQVNEDFSKHPFLNYLRLGLPVSLSTDDEGMFVTDIANEYKIAITYTDITHEELKQMAYNSIETAFADDAVKGELLRKLTLDFETFEAKWRNELSPAN